MDSISDGIRRGARDATLSTASVKTTPFDAALSDVRLRMNRRSISLFGGKNEALVRRLLAEHVKFFPRIVDNERRFRHVNAPLLITRSFLYLKSRCNPFKVSFSSTCHTA